MTLDVAKLPQKQAKKRVFAPFKTNTWYVDCGNREESEEVDNLGLAYPDFWPWKGDGFFTSDISNSQLKKKKKGISTSMISRRMCGVRREMCRKN